MHKLSGFVKLSGKQCRLNGQRIKTFFAFCGIGSPESFKKTVLSTGCSLKGIKNTATITLINKRTLKTSLKKQKQEMQAGLLQQKRTWSG